MGRWCMLQRHRRRVGIMSEVGNTSSLGTAILDLPVNSRVMGYTGREDTDYSFPIVRLEFLGTFDHDVPYRTTP
jgi:hypothetical protein